MKKFVFIFAFLMVMAALPAHAELNIFACEPEWGALSKEIGGDKVNVTIATTALQDPHQIQARPALIAAVRKADMVFCSGSELEVGWLPVLMRQGGSSKVQEGQDGYLMASDYVKKLEVPKVLDRSLGDIHPGGNPHIQTDPRNILAVAKVFTGRLKSIDSANGDYYETNYQNFSKKFSADITRWQAKAKPLYGMGIVVHHDAWAYMDNWLGLKVIASLEPKPGVPPTSSHLAEVLEKVKNNPPKVIIRAAYEDPKASEWLADKSGIKTVALPFTVGGNDEAKDLESLYENTIDLLLENGK